ncbi:ArsR family transcriptional regulator [Nocardioides sp. URHA0020]|uniref:ArsR family transcriptional regulator n=1 Tax=Nocardioides sp. URHA0020 TaxID=1380392 RepID=UPI0006841BF8|nr:ArsR family transcriptional regulator [Nocardioides sp. URHA0020]
MRKSAPPLLAILRSRLQGEILSAIYLSRWDAPLSISDLARELDEPVTSVHAEVRRLLEAGLLAEVKAGRSRLISAPDDTLVTRALRELLAVTFGPLPVLRGLLTELPGVEEAYIYGSWASRYSGAPGPTPNDVDVLVVGSVDLDLLDQIAETARGKLHREVNIRQISKKRWQHPGDDPFLRTIRDRPMVHLQALPNGLTTQTPAAADSP